MSKKLIIVRHGKAEKGYDKRDFDRNLQLKGVQQAHINGEKLQQNHTKANLILHSSANRTTQTAEILAEYLPQENLRLISDANLYLCAPSKIMDILVANAQDKDDCIILVGHNNGLSDFFNSIVANTLYHNLATCEMAIISLEIQSWSDLYSQYKATLLSLEQPNI